MRKKEGRTMEVQNERLRGREEVRDRERQREEKLKDSAGKSEGGMKENGKMRW